MAPVSDGGPPWPPTLIAVSLKMYFDHVQTVEWCSLLAARTDIFSALQGGNIELVVLPTFPSLEATISALSGTGIQVGAQDLFWEDSGAYTGEVSGQTLSQMGCRYVEIGHSERRRLFGETNETISLKLDAAIRHNLTAILCVGEEIHSSSDIAANDCISQLDDVIRTLGERSSLARLVVAYEPVWAIGADEPADIGHIVTVITAISLWLEEQGVNNHRVIYGGSAGPGLLEALGSTVDGLFLGRFAHDLDGLKRVLEEVTAQR